MDTRTARRHNLQQLAQRYPTRTAFAAALDRDEALLSRYLAGKPIGHQFARHVEHRLQLPPGAMDSPLDPLLSQPDLLDSVQRYLAASPDPLLTDTIARLLAILATHLPQAPR